MYNGKYNRKRRLRWKREFVLACSIAILVVGMVGGSLAYLFTNTAPVENTFTPAIPDVTIPEEFDGKTKTDVKVHNTSPFDAYARATYVAYWQDENGNVYPSKPEPGKDFTISIDNAWAGQKDDGYWYYKGALKKGDSSLFISSAKPVDGRAPEGYYLVVDVISEVVQAQPDQAIKDLWGADALDYVK